MSRAKLFGLFACGLLIACGPNNRGPGNGNGADANGNDNGDGNNNNGDGGGTGTNFPDAPPCASSPHKAEAAPLDMYIMLDQSGSMSGTKWTQVTTGLKQFVQQPNLAGFSVGIQYFGIDPGAQNCPVTCQKDQDCGTGGICFLNACICAGAGGDSCTASDYATPDVEIAPLPGISQQIVNSINAHSANSGTPTSAALQGAVDHAKAWANNHLADVTVVVLATDGEPEECDTDLSHINAIAAAGAAGNPKILTFVIGVGSSLSNLNGIAAAGGTGQAFIVDTNGNIGQQFLDALNQIRGSVLGCRYTIPLPDMGMPDYANVTVTYTPTGGSPMAVPHVANMAACPGNGVGWYYDNNTTPTQIELCNGTCATVSADKSGEVDILTPCSVIVN
ncbi:MAG TPA: vWA domain-containing protein [Kofleriaceae bacterium]|nr:vWA domain-containing protein [Kofleriaceae bacterium]